MVPNEEFSFVVNLIQDELVASNESAQAQAHQSLSVI
jgi:hypothetical protein